ncbi:hypothetical protein P7C73_g6411, partial [Tremellales sp. Uapishka_1]
MPRLQILQHKSYHPYLESNKQKVREDEAKARAEEAQQEQKRIDTEAEARLRLLRRQAGSPVPSPEPEVENLPSTSSFTGESSLVEKHKKKKAREEKREKKQRERLDFDFPKEDSWRNKGKEKEQFVDSGERNKEWEKGGHVNLFSDLEEREAKGGDIKSLEVAKKKADEKADPFTMYLSRPDKETKPWYTDREMKRAEEKEMSEEAEIRRARDAQAQRCPLKVTPRSSDLHQHPSVRASVVINLETEAQRPNALGPKARQDQAGAIRAPTGTGFDCKIQSACQSMGRDAKLDRRRQRARMGGGT